MKTDDAMAIVAAAFADRGRLPPEREVELGQAIGALMGNTISALERIAAAQELANLIAIFGHPNIDLSGDRTADIAMLLVDRALEPFRPELKQRAAK